MKTTRSSTGMWRSVIGLCAVGTLLTAACDQQTVDALTTALEVATQQMLEQDDDISFGDWLESEIEDW